MKKIVSVFVLILAVTLVLLVVRPSAGRAAPQQGQDVIRLLINKDLQSLKLAAADFRPAAADAEPLTRLFNDVLWSDLNNAGIFTLVSKSFYPQAVPSREEDAVVPGALKVWADPPVSVQALAFGNIQIVNNQILVNGFLYDVAGVRRAMIPRRYVEPASELNARAIAHRFADAIVEALGGGIKGIAQSKIYFCRSVKHPPKKPGESFETVKDIWVMDYDGANPRPVTQYGSITMTPAVSPDGSKLAFTTWIEGTGARIYTFSLASMRRLPFTNISGNTNTTPAWSPDGTKVAYAASFEGNMEIYVANENGGGARRLTSTIGVNTYPTWNPKTGAQVAFERGTGSSAQVYVMDSDGSNVRKLSAGEGDAVTPAWAPNGQVITFSWTRGFAPGNYNVFIVDVASGQLVQLTHGAGRNEHPWFSPDGRHIVFESDRNGKAKQIFTMLADGTQVRALTSAGENTSPVWSAQ